MEKLIVRVLTKLREKNSRVRLPWVTLFLLGLLSLFAWLPEGSQATLQYDRTAIASGEYWRIFTGHFVHWTNTHYYWDCIVFLIAGAFLETIRRFLFLLVGAVSISMISAGLFFFQPHLDYYRGISGVDMALVIAVCLMSASFCRLKRRKGLASMWYVVLGFCFLKPILETYFSASVFSVNLGTGVSVSAAAHLLGALAGVLATLSFWQVEHFCQRSNHSCRRLWAISTFYNSEYPSN